MRAVRTILHPTGLAKVDRAAFRGAGSLARADGARLVVLLVMRPWYLHGRARMLGAFLRQKMERWETLNRVRFGGPDICLEHRLTEGEPASAILRTAEELSCDLIVMGTHRRSGLTRLLKGSTAEAVLRKAPCPVLTVGDPSAGRLFCPDPWPATGLGNEVKASDLAGTLRVRRGRTWLADKERARPNRGNGPGAARCPAGSGPVLCARSERVGGCAGSPQSPRGGGGSDAPARP